MIQGCKSKQEYYDEFRKLSKFKDLGKKELVEYIDKHIEKVNEFGLKEAYDREEDLLVAYKFLDTYLIEYVIEGPNEKDILKEIIFLEVINLKHKKKLNELGEKVNTAIVSAIHTNIEKILELKEKLGILGSKKQDSSWESFELLQKRLELWTKENQASLTYRCGLCSGLNVLYVQKEHYNSFKHPFFSDTLLFNFELQYLYDIKQVSKESLALIYNTSIDYIDWLQNLIHNKLNPKYVEYLKSKKLSEEQIAQIFSNKSKSNKSFAVEPSNDSTQISPTSEVSE